MSTCTLFTPGTQLTLTLCLNEDSILLGVTVLEALRHPLQVQMLINEERQMLLLQACTVNDREAIVIPSMTLEYFVMSGRALLKRIRKLTGWMDDRPRVVLGRYLPTYNAIEFDLRSAQLLPLQMSLDYCPRHPS